MFGATGTLVKTSKQAQNQGKVRKLMCDQENLLLNGHAARPIPHRYLGRDDDGARQASNGSHTRAAGTLRILSSRFVMLIIPCIR